MLASGLERVIRGEKVHDSELAEIFGAEDGLANALAGSLTFNGPAVISGTNGEKSLAVVSVRGVALYGTEFQPYCFSTLLLAQTMQNLMNDPQIGTIVLDIDSPGGVVTGTPEAADAIYKARGKKKVVAIINPLAASAAYWLASQASEIVSVPSGDVGSIGVFMLHADCSKMWDEAGIKHTFIYAGKYKVEGNSYEPLGKEAQAHYQSEVDGIHRDFIGAVARGRGVAAETVKATFGQGRTVAAPEAKRLGMVDAVAAVEVAYARLGINLGLPQSRRRVDHQAARRARLAEFLNDVETPADIRRRRLNELAG